MNATDRKELALTCASLRALIESTKDKAGNVHAPALELILKAKNAYETAKEELIEACSTFASNLEDHVTDLGDKADSEQEKFDNMSEGLQQGERGQQLEQNANELNEAKEAIEALKDSLENMGDIDDDAIDGISNVIETAIGQVEAL